MTGADTGRLLRAALPVLAAVAFLAPLASTLAVAGETLGYDFLAYHQAARRILDGQPLYDMGFQATGGFGLFYYPPPFLPFILPFGLLDPTAAAWMWVGLLVAAFLVAVAILPVSRDVRLWVILLAGLSWPFVYAVKLGQVGPLLFLTFAVGWRWLDRPGPLGTSAAVGAAIKLQPALVFVWAVLTRRWQAVMWGVAILAGLAIVATALAGFRSWTDFLTLVRTVSEPITTPHNFTPGAVAFQLGMPAGIASAIQVTTTILAIATVLAAVRWATAEASYLVTVIASQLVSPILWDHYAMLLLLPVAYLLSAGHWWAAFVPLATGFLLVGVTPPVTYPVVFVLTLVATLVIGIRARRAEAR